jgi:predicted dehydrogenase
MDILSRREFLERSAILSAAAAALTGGSARADVRLATTAGSVNEKLRVAIVGVRSRGMSHVAGFLGKNNCEITTICDCDEAVIGAAMKAVDAKQGKPPKFEKDIRKVVEDKDVNVVSIAAPNHWHALMAVWAMENGKDVYCEKPASHNVHEGAIMTAAARRYNRICQIGTQSRSNPGMREAIAYVQGGKLGKVDLAIGLCYKPRTSIGDDGRTKGAQKPPATMDYDLWCGPAPLEMPKRNTRANGTVHYDWHWIWNYGNGDLGNQGVHEIDKARWGLNKSTMPNSAFSLGGRFGYLDDGETANTQLCLFDYGAEKLIFEVRGLKTGRYKDVGVGNIWVGSEGYVACPNYLGGIAYDKSGKETARFGWGKDAKGKEGFIGSDQHHYDNFVKAVRSRKHEDLNCDVHEGHLSASLSHLANISYRLGTEAPIGKSETVSSDKTLNEFAAAMVAHLKANGVEIEKTVGRFGPVLAVDPKTEKFTGSGVEAANKMLFREYRKGFELKEIA